MKTKIPFTKKQVSEIEPLPFEPKLSYTRFRDGQIVPRTHAAFSPPRVKKEFWPNEGKYKIKMTRGGE